MLGFSDELGLVGVGSFIERVSTKWQGLLSGRLTEGDALFLDEPHHEPISETTNDLENSTSTRMAMEQVETMAICGREWHDGTQTKY